MIHYLDPILIGITIVGGLVYYFLDQARHRPHPRDRTRLIAPFPGRALVATATEGWGEPRFTGSYALRLYAPVEPAWSRDTFAAGAVRPRRGGLAELVFEDLNGNGDPELIVVVRSAGSGGYLSADAFFVGRRGRLTFAGHVDDLPATADPVKALRLLLAPRNLSTSPSR